MNFYSEYCEDTYIGTNVWPIILRDYPDVAQNGFFLDIGCAHPSVCNNSAFLRDVGWSGLAIDGTDYTNLWAGQKGKFICAVLAAETGTAHFLNNTSVARMATPEEAAAGLAESRQAVTLNSILEAEKVSRIDYISIDVEAMEYDILKTFDFRLYLPSIVVAEYNTAGIGKDYRVLEHLLATGLYWAVHQTIANIVYVRKDIIAKK